MGTLTHQPVNRVVKIDRNRSDLFGEENVVEPRVLHNRPGRFIVGGPFEEEDQPWKTTQNRAADFFFNFYLILLPVDWLEILEEFSVQAPQLLHLDTGHAWRVN